MYMGSNGLRSRSVTPDIPDNFSDAGSIASERPSRPNSAKVNLLFSICYQRTNKKDLYFPI